MNLDFSFLIQGP